MNISNIDKQIKNINIITSCICCFLLLRILLVGNMTLEGVRGAILFAVLAPVLGWNCYKDFFNTYNDTTNESEGSYMGAPDINEQAQEIAERYSIELDDAIDMLSEYAYDEVCDALDSAEVKQQAQEIAERYSIELDDAIDMLSEYAYDEVCDALDRVEVEEQVQEVGEEEFDDDNGEEKYEEEEKVENYKASDDARTNNCCGLNRKIRDLDI